MRGTAAMEVEKRKNSFLAGAIALGLLFGIGMGNIAAGLLIGLAIGFGVKNVSYNKNKEKKQP